MWERMHALSTQPPDSGGIWQTRAGRQGPLRKGWMRREECVVKNLPRCWGSTRLRSVQRASKGTSTRTSGWVWQQVVEQFPSAIAIADSEGCIVAMNRAFRVQLSCWPGCAELPVSSPGVDLWTTVRAVMESPESG